MSSLLPCPSCQRHVRTGSDACPFCAGALDPAREATFAPPVRTAGRLGIFLAGALAASSCCADEPPAGVVTLQPDGSGGEQAPPTGGGGATNNGGGQVQPTPTPVPVPVPAYGAAPPPPRHDDDGGMQLHYGVPDFNPYE